MVISDEIKFPRPIHVDTFPSKEEVVLPAEGVAALKRVGAFQKEWSRSRQQSGKKKEKQKFGLLPGGRQHVRDLVDQVNNHLEKQGILLHLVLIKEEDGFTLDVYDCTDNKVCTVIRDFVVNYDDLPTLANKLESETGLLLDTVT